MLVEELRVGYHVSKKEKVFITSAVIPEIRQYDYDGPIEVVGSRKDGSRISTTLFQSQCQFLEPNESNYWLNQLNEIARKHDISAGEIKNITKYLPKDTPPSIREIFQSRHPDSDLDLTVTTNSMHIKANYYDLPCPRGSGLVVEIYKPYDYSYLQLSNYDF